MKKKNPKDNKGKKIPQPPNTFVPQNLLSSIRESKLISCPEDIQDKILKYIPFAQPFEIPPEWEEKTEEELNDELLPEEVKQQLIELNQKTIERTIEKKQSKIYKKKEKDKDKDKDKDLKINNKKEKETIEIKDEEEEEIKEPEIIIPTYNDNMHDELINNLPLSFLKITKNNFLWLRPEDYVINELLDKEIKRLYPKKKYIQMREDIKETYKIEKELSKLKEGEENKNYSEEENVDAFMNDDSETLKKTIYKDFYKYLQNKPKIKIVDNTERDEKEEEFQKRVYDTIERQKEALSKFKLSKNKSDKKPVIQKPEEFQRIKIYEQQPSNIDVKQIIEKEKVLKTFKEKNEFRINYSFISWLSSIYQFILDLKINDCITSKTIFSNIYPQQNGTPFYNPNGHYAIKLYFMGKPRRIDIDDRMPCNINGEYIFPRCEDLSELWPALLTKALLKLNIYKVKHPFYSKFEENVDTSYIYALTGYHTEIIQNLNQETEIKNLLYTNLNDENYLNKKKYILCLNLLGQKRENEKKEKFYEDIIQQYNNLREKLGLDNKINHVPLIKEEGILEEDDENTKSGEKKYSTNKLSIIGLKKSTSIDKKPNLAKSRIQKESKITDIIHKNTFTPFRFGANEKLNNLRFSLGKEITESYWKSRDVKQRVSKRQKTISLKGKLFIDNKIEIIYNFAYSINDFFSNGTFNMNRLKVLNFEDLKRNLKANNVIFKQLNKVEKREYIKQRKILKAKQLDIKNKRIEELKNEGKPFLIIKIKNDSSGQYKINSVLMYTEEEIYMAKKCILNNWKYPPPDFFKKYFDKYEILNNTEDEKGNNENIKNNEKKLIKKKFSSLDWTKENYIQLIGGDLSQFESNEENKIKEPIQKTSGGNWMSFSDFIFLFNTFLILHNPNSLFTGGKVSIDNNWLDYKIDCFEPMDDFMVLKLNNDEIENKEKTYVSFIVFEPNNDKTLKGKDKINNYIIFDIIDENQNIIYKNITMNRFYSTHIVENLSGNLKYYIIVRGGIYQFGFYLEFYSEGHKIENMTYQNYLCQSLDYKFANFKIEHPVIGNEPFYLLSRLHIIPNINEDGSQIPEGELGDFNIVFNIKYPIKHLKKYIKLFLQKEEKDNNIFNNGKEIFINEQIHLKEGSYLIAIYFQNLPMSIKENICDIDVVYSNKNYNIEQIDNIDFYEVGDEYKPNKYNIIFKEKIYACDTIYASLNIQLSQNIIDEKIKLIFLLYQLADKDNEQISLIEKKFTHGLRGYLIKRFESYNSIIIPNIKFKGGLIIPDKKGGKAQQPNPQTEPQYFPYLLIGYIDDSFDINKNISSENKLLWTIRVFSSDNLCFIADLSKEENEKLLKNNWEEKEPGRASLAKISRKRYIIEKIKRKGGEITNEDIALLNSQRTRKMTRTKDDLQETQNLKNKGKKASSKIQINSKKIDDKDNKKEETKELILNFNKTLPKDIFHQSIYIKNYLKYAYKNRTKRINTIEDQYKKVINNEKTQAEKSKNILESMDLYNKVLKTEMSSTFYKTQQPKDEMFSTFYKLDISTRTNENDRLKELMKSRDTLKSQFKEKINAQNTVSDILKNYIVNSYDYPYMIQAYKDTVEILGKDYEDEVKLFKLLSSKKEEEIKNQMKKFTAKDKNNITKLIEEIEFNQLIISEEVMTKLREFIK